MMVPTFGKESNHLPCQDFFHQDLCKNCEKVDPTFQDPDQSVRIHEAVACYQTEHRARGTPVIGVVFILVQIGSDLFTAQ